MSIVAGCAETGDSGVTQVDGFISQGFIGVGIDQRLARAVDMPVQCPAFQDGLHIGGVARAEDDAAFFCADNIGGFFEFALGNDQRLAEERPDCRRRNAGNGACFCGLNPDARAQFIGF